MGLITVAERNATMKKVIINGVENMSEKPRHICITGGAGFIGSHLAENLLKRGDKVVVFDNFDPFYAESMKRSNIQECLKSANYELVEGNLLNQADLDLLFARENFDVVVHLAALAGVRPSLERPADYMQVNVVGTQHLIDRMKRQSNLPRFVFASSSSVYGERAGGAFSETDSTKRQLSPYGASKMSGELICYAAHHTLDLQVIALRFFTVYGARQRPDLAIHKFCRLIDKGESIEMYGDGKSKRDYTYIDDIINGVTASIDSTEHGYEVLNLGRSEPAYLSDMIEYIELALGKKANIIRKPPQLGDVPYTSANIEKARQMLAYAPSTSLKDGIKSFVQWYQQL